MIWLNFEKWSCRGGRIFFYRRIYRKGYIWTPFVKFRFRYKPWYRDFVNKKKILVGECALDAPKEADTVLIDIKGN